MKNVDTHHESFIYKLQVIKNVSPKKHLTNLYEINGKYLNYYLIYVEMHFDTYWKVGFENIMVDEVFSPSNKKLHFP